MSINTYTDPVLTTELREWFENMSWEEYNLSPEDDPQCTQTTSQIVTLKWKHTPEAIEKIRKYSKTLIGEKNPMYGKKHSEENKKKWSKALKGGTLTEEHKRKISESHMGVKRGPYKKRKIKNIL